MNDDSIKYLFKKMESRYGEAWAAKYGIRPRDQVMQSWAEDLGTLSASELRRGLDACMQVKHPPSCPEFFTLCRPQIDPWTAHIEACTLFPLWLQGAKVQFSKPEIFWAAKKIGAHDLRMVEYRFLQARWKTALETAPNAPVQAPPKQPQALPPPKADKDRVRAVLKDLDRLPAIMKLDRRKPEEVKREVDQELAMRNFYDEWDVRHEPR